MTMTTTPLESMEVEVSPVLVVQCHSSSSPAPEAISAAMGKAFSKVESFLKRNALPAAGPPRATYTEWGADAVKFTAAIPIADVPPGIRDSDDVAITAIPESHALRFVHYGPYSELRETYARIEAWLRQRGGIRTPNDWGRYAPMWEEYLNDPSTTPASELVTHIFLTLQ